MTFVPGNFKTQARTLSVFWLCLELIVDVCIVYGDIANWSVFIPKNKNLQVPFYSPPVKMSSGNTLSKSKAREFPGGPVVGTLHCFHSLQGARV